MRAVSVSVYIPNALVRVVDLTLQPDVDMQLSQSDDVDQINDDDAEMDEEEAQQENEDADGAEEDEVMDDKDGDAEEEDLPDVSRFPTLVT